MEIKLMVKDVNSNYYRTNGISEEIITEEFFNSNKNKNKHLIDYNIIKE